MTAEHARSVEAGSADPAASDTDERILEAAVRVLARGGIAGVSMRKVAAEAGVAVGLANYHFDGKTALIEAALRRIGQTDLLLVAPEGDDPATRLRSALDGVVDRRLMQTDYLGLRLQLWSLAAVDDRYAAINKAAQNAYLDGLRTLLREARPDLDDAEIARRAADILVVQNGIWLTGMLIDDEATTARALARTHDLAFA